MKFCVLILPVLLLISIKSLAQRSDFWQISFTKADSIADRFKGYSLKNPEQLADSLVQGLGTDVEKFRALFKWIADNIAYDVDLYQKILTKETTLKYNKKKGSAFTERASKKIFQHMVYRKQTICAGYATLLDYMCSHVGLQSVFISGYARTYGEFRGPNHAWNAVKIGDKWYLCDVTWASGYVDDETRRFVRDFHETYFLTDPNLMVSNHYPSDKAWTLIKDGPSLQDFMTGPLKLRGFISNRINQLSPSKKMIRVKKGEPVKISFTSNAENISPTALLIINKTTDRKYRELVEVELERNTIGEYILLYSFQAPGSYRLYIDINHKQTLAYEVAVN
jgi:transglutaminase/protease-like cytokinesis protein 3